jgi:CHAT domain-containing protein
MQTRLKFSSIVFRQALSLVQALFMFSLLSPLVAAQGVEPEIRPLVPGQTTERKVTADEEVHVYAIEMKRGQVLRVSFKEKGADVGVYMIRAADQLKASAVSSSGSGFMKESLTLIADRDGGYLLVIRAQRVTNTNVEASYTFSTVLSNTVNQSDIQRVKAETLMEEGRTLLEGTDSNDGALAVSKFEESMKIWNLLAEDYWAEIAKGSMASGYFRAGNFPKAELFMTQVLKTFTERKDEPGIAAMSASLVALYWVSNNEKAVNQHLQKALEISRRLGDKRAESLLGFIGVSKLAVETDNRDFAKDLAAARANNDKLAEASVWARTLFHYVVEEDSIEDEEQREFFVKAEREALPLLRTIKNRDIELQIFLGLGVGFYDLTLGSSTDEAADLANKEKSINYTSHAIVLAKVLNNPLIQSLAYNQLNLYYDGDNDRLAILFGKKAINALQDLRQDLRALDKETQQDATKAFTEEFYNSLASDLFYVGRLAEAHQVLNLGRDQEYFDFSLTRIQEPAKLSMTSRELESDQLLNRAIENIVAKYSSRPDADYQAAAAELKVTLKQLEQNFAAPPSERDIATNIPDTQDLQFALRELNTRTGKKHVAIYVVEDVGEVLLITQEGIFAFASSTKVGDFSTYVSSFVIDDYILDFLKILRSPDLDPRPLGSKIYTKIFKTKELVHGESTETTLEEKLARLKPDVLLWSLSGNIRYIPVAALYDENTGQYLVQKYQNTVFTRARKERFLIEPKPWTSAVGFGTSLGYGDLSPLPDVPIEISTIFGNSATRQKGFFAGQVFLNRAFTRKAMVASLQSQPGLVHIASHFIFRPGDSRNSFLLLGDGSRFSLREMQQTPNLFAGVDLLTLSACETAGQQAGANGREVDGFAELAQRLGATSVIATLWRIADDKTSTFMSEFYRMRQVNPTAPKSEILREAQLSLLRGKGTTVSSGNRRGPADIVGLKETLTGIPFKPNPQTPLEHPYYWAPFVLFGSSR